MKKTTRGPGAVVAMVVLGSVALQAQHALSKSVTAVTAEIETNQTTFLADGNTLQRAVGSRFYRDSKGRTRLEQGPIVTISDPGQGLTIVLDLEKRTARKLRGPSQRTPVNQNAQPSLSVTQRASLGVRLIEGAEAVGKEFIAIIPAGSPIGNSKPLEQVTEVWHSEALQLPLLVIVTDPVAGKLVTRYTNIRQIEPQASLFEIPSGFQESSGQ